MVYSHFAYRFEPDAAAQPFLPLVGRRARGRSKALRDRAEAALARPSDAFREALVAMRYDDGWIGNDPDEAHVDAKCFVLGFIADCRSVPSLGRGGEPAYHVVLTVLLTEAGWPREDIHALLRGESLVGCLEEVGLGGLARALPGLDQIIGWLGPPKAKDLAANLGRLRARTTELMERRADDVAPLVQAAGGDARGVALQAWDRAERMLAEGGSPGSGLLLVLD